MKDKIQNFNQETNVNCMFHFVFQAVILNCFRNNSYHSVTKQSEDSVKKRGDGGKT